MVVVGMFGLTGMTRADPDQCQLHKMVASDGTAGDRFGRCVSLSGETAVIGAPYNDDLGSAYVFAKVDGIWAQTAKLSAEEGTAGDFFGTSVALSGETAIVGAWGDDDSGDDSGSAYVFAKVGGIWMQTATLTAEDGAAGDFFGTSVALSGETAIVGAWGDDDSGDDSGSAYMFEKVAGVWTQTAKLIVDGVESNDQFGLSVALSGETAVVGAPFDDDSGDDSGAAYMFEKVDGVWTQTAKLTADGAASDDQFGLSVALSGETAIVGAWGDDDSGEASGSTYVFAKVDGVWTQTAKLTAQDGTAGDRFGDSVALNGDTAAIGALGDDGSGSVYVFAKVDGVWTQTAKLTAEDGTAGDRFGDSVALSGDAVVVGAWGDDDSGGDSGSAYVFLVTGEDCNNNGVPDECDLVLAMEFVHQSGEFSPFQSGVDARELIPAPPIAIGDVTLTVDVKADLNTGSEFVDVFLNGMPVGRLFEFGGVECPVAFDMGSLVIPEASFNALLPGDVTVDLVPSTDVGFCDGVVKLSLSYDTPASIDCNGSGVPDECETDGDGDGVIDDCDPCPLDNPDDTDADGLCDADDLCPDTPLGLLVDLDGCTLSEGPCCFPEDFCIDGTDPESCEAFPGGVFQGEGLTCGDPDGDGVVGCADGCPLDPEKTDPGVCGCGVSDDDDEDQDGIVDCNDRCSKTSPGVPVSVCGCAEVGACCGPGGACLDDTERTGCFMIAGIYQGDGSTCADGCDFGDLNADGNVDLADVGVFQLCFTGAEGEATPACLEADADGCGPIDLDDFAAFRAALTGP